MGSIKGRDDALGEAIKLEKATLLFYHALREAIGEKTVLDAVIRAEKDHLVALTKVLLTEAKFRGLGDTW